MRNRLLSRNLNFKYSYTGNTVGKVACSENLIGGFSMLYAVVTEWRMSV